MRSVLVMAVLVVMLLFALSLVQRWQAALGRIPAVAPVLPAQDQAPSFTTNRGLEAARGPVAPHVVSDTWLNSEPLSPADLRGKVVLVDFWTFDCINCRNTIPYLRAWYEKYHDQGLVIVGVHSPEFTFERDVANVKQAIQDLKIPYPIALDNDFKTWNAYHVYAESEQTLLALLKE